MKINFRMIVALCVLVVAGSAARAEDLETFLKRCGTGATEQDLHANFHGTVIANGQAYDVDRAAVLKNVAGQKAAGTLLVVDNLEIVSKAETPDKDGKGAVISLVVKVSVTEKVGGSTLKIQSEDHHVIVRDPDGTFHLLYLVVAKEIRKA